MYVYIDNAEPQMGCENDSKTSETISYAVQCNRLSAVFWFYCKIIVLL